MFAWVLVFHKKIPNLKYQITNKFQISIFNDPNIHHSCIASHHQLRASGRDAVSTTRGGFFVLNLEFGSL